MYRARYLGALALTALLALPTLVFAQSSDEATAPGAGPAYGPRHEEVMARYQEVRAKVLRADVGLDEATAAQAEQILDDFAKQHQELKRQMRQYRQTIRSLLVLDSTDQDAYQEALEGLLGTQNKLHSLRQEQIEALSPLMTPKQQAQFLMRMQEMRRRAGKMLRGRGRGPYGGGQGFGFGPGPGAGGPPAWN